MINRRLRIEEKMSSDKLSPQTLFIVLVSAVLRFVRLCVRACVCVCYEVLVSWDSASSRGRTHFISVRFSFISSSPNLFYFRWLSSLYFWYFFNESPECARTSTLARACAFSHIQPKRVRARGCSCEHLFFAHFLLILKLISSWSGNKPRDSSMPLIIYIINKHIIVWCKYLTLS